MNNKQFGELVKALRREHLDENLQSWTRQRLSREIAKASGKQLKPDALGKIERGERQYLSSDELVSLADGLRLTSVERQSFFHASTNINYQDIGRQQAAPEHLLSNLLADLQGIRLPFFLVDSYADAIAMNTMLAKFLKIPIDTVPKLRQQTTGFNILKIIFDPALGSWQSDLGTGCPTQYFTLSRKLHSLPSNPLFQTSDGNAAQNRGISLAVGRNLLAR